MINEKEKQTCSGCSACANICPNNCIEMRLDKQGFRYPHINHEKCIHCGLCDKVCENASLKTVASILPKGFAAFAKNDELRLSSSSGGVFTLLADKALEKDGTVVGAAFSEDFRTVRHLVADTKEDIKAFRSSKYLQSTIGDTFKKIRRQLKKGRYVLFSGTPCQVAGLKAFLQTDYDNLLCVDIICHGVPSPKVWAKYCDEIEYKCKGKITSVNFRQKKFGWENFGMDLSFKGGKQLYLSKEEDPYLRLFLKNYILRPSCYHCSHKGINRKADITIADFWGVHSILPDFSDGKGTSLMLVHTEKGRLFVKAIEDYVKLAEVDVNKAVELNKAAISSAKLPTKIGHFWKDFENMTIESLSKKYTPIRLKKKIKLAIRKTNLYRIFKKLGERGR